MKYIAALNRKISSAFAFLAGGLLFTVIIFAILNNNIRNEMESVRLGNVYAESITYDKLADDVFTTVEYTLSDGSTAQARVIKGSTSGGQPMGKFYIELENGEIVEAEIKDPDKFDISNYAGDIKDIVGYLITDELNKLDLSGDTITNETTEVTQVITIDLSASSVASSHIIDGTIVDEDISNTAGIGWDKVNKTGSNISNWDNAYGWGDHSLVGYLTGASADSAYLRLDATNDPITGQLNIQVPTATSSALILQTTDDNATINIFEVQNSSGTPLVNINSTGGIVSPVAVGGTSLDIATNNGSAAIRVISTNTSSEDLLNFQANSSSDIFKIRHVVSGANHWPRLQMERGGVENIRLDPNEGNVSFINGTTRFEAISADNIVTTIKAAASQTANLTEWQNSSGGVLVNIDSSGNLLVSKNTALGGTAINTDIILTANSDARDPTSAKIGANFNRTLKLTSTNNFNVTGGAFNVSTRNDNFNATGVYTGGQFSFISGNIATVDDARAGSFLAYNTGVGTITDSYAGYFNTQNLTTGILTNSYGLYYEVGFNNGTIVNNYGLYLENISGGSTNYAIYTNAGDVRFGDDVLIEASSASNVPLTIKAAASQTANLTEWQDSSGGGMSKVDANGFFYAQKTITDTTGSLVLYNANSAINPGASSDAVYVGFKSNLGTIGSENITGAIRGVDFRIDHGSSGILANLYNVYARSVVSGGGILTNRYGAFIVGTNVSSGTLVNEYGVYIDDIDAGSTLNYAIYTNAGVNRFGDEVRIEDDVAILNLVDTDDGGTWGMTAISRDNIQLGFDVEYTTAGAATAKDTSTARFIKNADLLKLRRADGQTPGNSVSGEVDALTLDLLTGNILLNGFDSSAVGLTIKAASSQTANLTEWQNSSGGILASINASGGAVFNEASLDTDFRVESNALTHAIFVDGGNNTVGIGTASPGERLGVAGNIRTTGSSPQVQWYSPGFSNPMTIGGAIDADMGGRILINSPAGVGLGMQGFSNAGNLPGFRQQGHVGSNTPTQFPYVFEAFKLDGGTGRTTLATSEKAYGFFNGQYDTGTILMSILGGGNVGIGTDSPTELLDINSDSIRIRTSKTPASAAATCDQGEISWDTDYMYVCTATNTWKRTTLSSW